MHVTDEELHRSIDRSERWAFCGGIAVIIGVSAEAVLAYRHATTTHFEAIWGPVIADSLVALGVAAELWFSGRASIRQREIQRRSDIAVAEANERAQQASKDAADTRERAAKIEQLTAWRHVPKNKQAELVTYLQKVGTSIRIHIDYQTGDPEAFSYAREIANIFKEAGIDVNSKPNFYIGAPVFGLHITGIEGLDRASMVKAFSDAGISLDGVPELSATVTLHGIHKPSLCIFAGPKKPPSF
jgi:hypothetical protein